MTQQATLQVRAPKNSLAQNLSPTLKKLLIKRNIQGDKWDEFFSWNLHQLPLLDSLLDVDKSTQRILAAISNNELIGIYGDYDVDGTTSCALLYHFFKMLDTHVELIQPGRFKEGYGIHPPAVEKAYAQGIRVLITVDCGITNNEAALKAKEIGLDLIITDHHRDGNESMPDAFAIINPSRRDEPVDSLLKPLAGVGVAFALALKIKKEWEATGGSCPSLYPLLQFVAIGTICDLAKLTPMNLKLVRHGLKQLGQTNYLGLRAFLTKDEREKDFIPSEKLSFQIGPIINSKGRLDHPEKSLKLLIADDATEAYNLYAHLESCNQERKLIQHQVVTQAKEQLQKSFKGSENHLISILYDPEWHEGVIGIVASRIVEEYKAPAIIFSDAEEEGVIKASARSAGDELDIFNLLKEHADLYIKFGGHKAAAGLSMKKENLPAFRERMNQSLKDVPAILRTVQDSYDIEIAPKEITLSFLKELEMLEPFGQGNTKPIFKMKNFKIDSYDILKEKHIRWNLTGKQCHTKLKGISFNLVGKWGLPHPEKIYRAQNIHDVDLTAYFTLGINHFRGNQFIQLLIDKILINEF